MNSLSSTSMHRHVVGQQVNALAMPAAMMSLRPKPAIQVWLELCVEEALQGVHDKGVAFKSGAAIPLTEREARDRANRYDLLDVLLAPQGVKGGRSGREMLGWVVAGYLSEFVRQTRDDVPPLNIANPQRPQPVAKEYWSRLPKEVFDREIFPGVRHTALAYHLLEAERLRLTSAEGRRTGRKASWDAASELLRASIDTFRQRGREIFPEGALRASVYNNHLYVIEFARRVFCAHDVRSKLGA